MKQASLGSAVSQAEAILEHIHKMEESRKVEFSEYTLFSMGGGGALKAVLSGDGPVILMQMTMIIKERDGKWHVSGVSLD
jgi:hypothetical protein